MTRGDNGPCSSTTPHSTDGRTLIPADSLFLTVEPESELQQNCCQSGANCAHKASFLSDSLDSPVTGVPKTGEFGSWRQCHHPDLWS